MMRKEAAAGQFYEASRKELTEHLDELFKLKGSDAQKIKIKVKAAKNVIGLIVPHAGYAYSGKAAASGYQMLKGMEIDTFIVIGVNHSGFESSVSLEDFETPLGIAENDDEFSEELAETIGKNEFPHKYEHSIEVQLPFLQYLFRTIKIVPVIIGNENYEKCLEIADAIAKIAKRQVKKVCIIASSDFTHYGQGYGFLPFAGTDEEVKKRMYALDKKAISFIEKMNGKEFFEFSSKTTICGRIPITIAIEACKLMKAKAKLIDYYTSGDVVRDYRNAVGYAAISFEK
jgi:hypothetical protein